MRRAVVLLGATGGLLGVAGGLVAAGLFGDEYVAVTSGVVTAGWRVLAASSVLAGAAALLGVALVRRDSPRAWLVLALAGLAGLAGGRGYFMVPGLLLLAAALLDYQRVRVPPLAMRAKPGTRRRLVALGLALVGGALGLLAGLLLLGAFGDYWALGGGRPGLEERLIAFSVLLCGVTILVAAGLLRSHPRPAAGLLLLAAVYGLLGGLSLWFPAGIFAAAAVLVSGALRPPLGQPG